MFTIVKFIIMIIKIEKVNDTLLDYTISNGIHVC